MYDMAKLLPTADQSSDLALPVPTPRRYPIDAASVEMQPHRYLEPEVNRLKEWALWATVESAEETMLNANVEALPPGLAICLMIAASLVLWSAVAGAVALLV